MAAAHPGKSKAKLIQETLQIPESNGASTTCNVLERSSRPRHFDLPSIEAQDKVFTEPSIVLCRLAVRGKDDK